MPILKPTRRDLFKLAALAPCFALPAVAQADVTGPAGAQAAFHRLTIGQAKITVVSDGHLDLPTIGLGVNADRDEVLAFLSAHYLSAEQHYSHTNHVVIEIGDAVVLIDVGSGARFVPSAGKLMANLELAGFALDAITHVIITHAHPDHVWGIRDDFDEPILPNAEYIIGEAEFAWWMADGRVSQVPETLQQFAAGAVTALSTEGIDWTMVQDSHEVVSGVRLIHTPGHTSGHMSVMVESDGAQLLITGDAMTHAVINTERPDWFGNNDQEPELSVATRKRLLDMAATDRIAVLGYHFPFPGVGHIMRDGAAYRYIPALWRWQA